LSNDWMHIGPDDDNSSDQLDPALMSVVAALRVPVDPAPDFETRVMHAVRETAKVAEIAHSPWWRRRSITISPAAALALAASIAFIAFIGARSVEFTSVQQAERPPAASTELVRFVYVDRNASEVYLVGNFNQWQKDATPLQATGVPGVWAVVVPLSAGMHEYAFVVDGERWAPDPLAPGKTDEFGTESSVIRVQGPTSS
jgi:hypothetical protein